MSGCFIPSIDLRRVTYCSSSDVARWLVVPLLLVSYADGHDKSSFGFIKTLWDNVKLTVWLYIGYFPFVWALSGYLLEQAGGLDSSYVLTQTCVFYIVDATIDTILSLPFTAYKTFVVEEKHGFNKQTVSLFLTDSMKGLLLHAAIAPPLIYLFVRVIEAGGEYFYLYVAALFFVVQMVAIPFYSNFIQPCFNKVEPLAEGTLRTSIEKLASSIDFPLTGLYVIDGSKRSSHSNAYFCQPSTHRTDSNDLP
jgi:STE24 endopeptidase